MSKIVPFLWFAARAEEAVALYTALVPNSHVDHTTTLPIDSPSGPAGTVNIIEFTLAGQAFTAFNGGPHEPFNHAVSFTIRCEDQRELDRIWDALLAGGGHTEACGWLKDRFGVSWQIVPARFDHMMRDPDRVKATRVAQAMMKMVKLDIAALEKAYAG